MTFGFKKAAVILAASALCMSCAGMGGMSVFAEEEQEVAVTEEAEEKKSDPVDSEDGMWQYTIINKGEDDEFACIEKYYGDGIEITFPEEVDGYKVNEIGDYVLYENTAIEKVIIPASVEKMGRSPFFGCTSLKAFEVNSANAGYTAEDGVLYSKNKEILTCVPAGRKYTEFKVPDGVRALGPSAFAVCKELKKIELPDSLELIDFYCFAECESLDNVVLPDKVTDLEMFAFTGCTALKNIKLSDTLTNIGGGAFFSCSSLKDIKIPDSVITIGQCAFVSTGFVEIEVPVYVQEIGYNAFGYTTDKEGQLVPMEKFTVKGVEGSYAQGYCSEHEHVEFQAVEMPTEAAKNSGNDNKSDTGTENRFKKAAVLGGAALGGCAVIALLVLLIRKLTGKGASVKDTSEKSVPENDMGKDEVTVEEPSEQAGQDGKSEETEQ